MDFDLYGEVPIQRQEYFKSQVYPQALYNLNST